MSFYNPMFDEKRRVEQKPYTKYQVGKSREQGAQGATQGSQGWMAQYQPMLDAITKGSQLPQLKQHNSPVGTQGWMNEALGNVQIHNLQKMAMQRNRAVANLLGGIMRADTQQRTAAMANATRERLAAIDAVTRKYRIDKNFDYRKQALDETSKHHNQMADYYKGLLGNQQQKAAIDLYKAQHPKQPKTPNPLDLAIKRAKIVPDDATFKALIPDQKVADEIGSENLKKARLYYIQTGKMPSFTKESGFFDDDYAPVTAAPQQANATAKQESSAVRKVTPDQIKTIHNEIAKDYGLNPDQVTFDPKRKMYVLPNGKGIPFETSYSIVFGG